MLNYLKKKKILQEQIEQYKQEQAQIESEIKAAIEWSGDLAIQYTGGVMAWPIAKAGTYITSGYGTRLHQYKEYTSIIVD